jgi:hypothetical protein
MLPITVSFRLRLGIIRLNGVSALSSPSFHCTVMRMRLQVVVAARLTQEMDNLLFSFAHFRHSALTSEISGSIEPAFWKGDAEASASSDASASCYRLSEDVRVLAIIVAELKFV